MSITDSFATIVYSLSLSQRRALSLHIAEVQGAIGSTVDFTTDRRAATPKPPKPPKPPKEPKPPKVARPTGRPAAKLVRVIWRNGFGPIECTYAEAAAQVGKSEHNIRCQLSLKKGRWAFTVDEELVTIERI